MQTSPRWSSVSAPFRLELTRSRALAALYVVLAVLAALAACASEMPRPAALMVAAAAVLEGIRLAGHEWRRAASELTVDAAGRAFLDSNPVHRLHATWRGPLACVGWRDAAGRTQRRLLPPHRLRGPARRELRLALRRVSNAATASVAP